MTYVAIPPALRDWAIAVGGPHDDNLMVEEAVIAAGERVLAQGLAERSPDGTLFLRAHPEHELVLTTFGEPELVEVLRREAQLGLVLLMVFVVLTGLGIVLAAIGWYVDL